jgi:hypothetical protein
MRRGRWMQGVDTARWLALVVLFELAHQAFFPRFRLWRGRPASRRRVALAVIRGVAIGLVLERMRRHNERVEGRAPEEARRMLSEQVEAIRARSYAEHASRIPSRGSLLGLLPAEDADERELRGPSGETYDLRVTTGWADRPGNDVEITVMVIESGFASVARETVRLAPG